MKKLHSLFILLTVIVAGNLCAQPVVALQSGPRKLNGMQMCSFVDDTMTMLVISSGKIFAKHYFCSSSGDTTAKLVTDSVGDNYILLKYGTGHGTNALQEYLEVFALPTDLSEVSKGMYEYLRTPISGGAGLSSVWNYQYIIGKPKCGGLEILFIRSIEGPEQKTLTTPAQKTRIIDVNVPKNCLR